MLKVEKELANTKEILYQTIEKAITRGEKLEEVAEKSNDLNARSKVLLKNAKKANKCCGP